MLLPKKNATTTNISVRKAAKERTALLILGPIKFYYWNHNQRFQNKQQGKLLGPRGRKVLLVAVTSQTTDKSWEKSHRRCQISFWQIPLVPTGFMRHSQRPQSLMILYFPKLLEWLQCVTIQSFKHSHTWHNVRCKGN